MTDAWSLTLLVQEAESAAEGVGGDVYRQGRPLLPPPVAPRPPYPCWYRELNLLPKAWETMRGRDRRGRPDSTPQPSPFALSHPCC